MPRKHHLLPLFSIIVSATAFAGYDGFEDVVWQNLNPGFGGNVQSLDCDPNTPGRIYFSSDMEGCYRSDDFGESWIYLGHELSYSYVNDVTVEPGDASRVYAGTRGSIEISDNAGLNWERVPGINDNIGLIALHPDQPETVWAIPGERHRWRGKPDGVPSPWGERILYKSDDRGQSWTTLKYEEGLGRRDNLTFTLHPDDPATAYLGSIGGIYKTTDGGQSWTPLPSPTDVGDHTGATLSSDGEYLYATFRVPSNGEPAIVTSRPDQSMSAQGYCHLFVTATDKIDWVNISQDAPGFSVGKQKKALFWKPEFNYNSSPQRHQILIGTYRPQHGLWTVDVSPDSRGRMSQAQWTEILGYDADEQHHRYHELPYDIGWEHWGITAEDYSYTPPSWGDPHIIASGGQTAFKTRLSNPDFAQSWEPIYTRLVTDYGNGVRTHRTRGAQSVFVWDADGHQNYVAQSNADNCLMESYDGGYSWTEDTKPAPRIHSRSNSVTILREFNPPIVLAHMAVGWGANVRQETNALWAKPLVTHSPEDVWVKLGGGETQLAGMEQDEYTHIVYHPSCPQRVLVATRYKGIYQINNIAAHYSAIAQGQEPPPAYKIAAGGKGSPQGVVYWGTGLAFDPNDPKVIYANGQKKFWKAEFNKKKGWKWEVLQESQVNDFAVWDLAGKTLLAKTDHANGANEDHIEYSTDGGKKWRRLLDFQQVQAVRKSEKKWHEESDKLRILGMTAKGKYLYFAYCTDQNKRRTFGYFRATVSADGLQEIEDFTADLQYPYPVSARIISEGETDYLYFSSRGSGLWRRKL